LFLEFQKTSTGRLVDCSAKGAAIAVDMDAVLIEEKSPSDLDELGEEGARRHLAALSLCSEAKADILGTISADNTDGIIPLPEGAFKEECFFVY
jgi:hypothetical protein